MNGSGIGFLAVDQMHEGHWKGCAEKLESGEIIPRQFFTLLEPRSDGVLIVGPLGARLTLLCLSVCIVIYYS